MIEGGVGEILYLLMVGDCEVRSGIFCQEEHEFASTLSNAFSYSWGINVHVGNPLDCTRHPNSLEFLTDQQI